MRRDEALAILTKHQDELKNLGIKSLSLFGSVARDEARPDSDVDLLMELDYGNLPPWGIVDIRLHLKNLLNREIDIANPSLLKSRIRNRILQEAIPILSLPQTCKPNNEGLDDMPKKDWKAYIDDIIAAAAKIERYTKNLSFEDFLADERTVDAVLHNITIIGEAVSTQKLPRNIQEHNPQIEWTRINEVRNIVVHQYDEVDLKVIWKICRENIPTLIPQLQQLLTSESEQ